MLTVDEVRKIRLDKARVNHETYKGILAQVYTRIRQVATMHGVSLVARVPHLVPGRPVFNPAHAERYVTEKLRLGGFDVSPLGGGLLAVQWTVKDRKDRQDRRKDRKDRHHHRRRSDRTSSDRRSDKDRSDKDRTTSPGLSPVPGLTDPVEVSRRLEALKRRLRTR